MKTHHILLSGSEDPSHPPFWIRRPITPSLLQQKTHQRLSSGAGAIVSKVKPNGYDVLKKQEVRYYLDFNT
ncbi:unnamed protein product [Boreogadus saida]